MAHIFDISSPYKFIKFDGKVSHLWI